MYELVETRYGKDVVRLYKVHRDKDSGVHDVCEMTLTIMLQGDISASYVSTTVSISRSAY